VEISRSARAVRRDPWILPSRRPARNASRSRATLHLTGVLQLQLAVSRVAIPCRTRARRGVDPGAAGRRL